jgi:predicted permease
MANLRLAFRTLLKTPFVSIIAVVSLALGIGANAAIFSLFDQILLRSLPVHEPERLVNLGAPGPKPGMNSCGNQGPCSDVFSYPMFRDLERVQTSFEGLAAHREFGANLSYRGQTMNGEGMTVSGSYFPLLGVRPALGRLLTPEDDRTIGGHFVVVLSEAYWRTRFDSSPAVLNETLIVNGQAMTIVGVAARDFHGTSLGKRPHVYVPITMRGLMQPNFVRPTPNGNTFENRRGYWVYVFGRLKPGVSIEQAKTAINGPYRSIVADVEAPLQQGMSEQTMARFKAKEITVSEGYRGQSSIHEEASTPLYLLLGVTGFVLLIACANIANLLLARAAGRAGEMAVRLSIGASRRQLVTQLLTESLLLAVLGALVGLLVSRWTLALMASLLPAEAAATLDFTLDRTAVMWAGVLAVGTGVLFGLFPAFHSTRPDLVTTLKDQAGQKGSSKAASRFRAGLATAQIALSMTLLVAAGLFTRSLLNVSRVDLGIRTDNVITFAISPMLNGYTPQRTVALFEQLEDELGSLPGVSGVTTSTVGLISGSNWGTGVAVQGFEAGPDTDTGSNFTLIGPGYFRTLGIPLLAGREFTRADAIGAAKVAIVNEAFAKKFNLGRDAVGKRMMNDSRANAKLEIEIVGLVQNAKYSEVKQEIPPVFFLPYRQDERIGFINFYVRTAGDPDSLLGAINSVVARRDANLPVENLKTLQQQVQENVFLDRIIGTFSSAFAILATLLAAVGLYGVLAYTVAQRTREIGLRMALGADGSRVRAMVLKQVLWMTIVGGVVGIAAAVGLGQLAQSLLFELRGHDPMVLGVSAALLGLVAFGAGFVPARRASRIDPMLALRYE